MWEKKIWAWVTWQYKIPFSLSLNGNATRSLRWLPLFIQKLSWNCAVAISSTKVCSNIQLVDLEIRRVANNLFCETSSSLNQSRTALSWRCCRNYLRYFLLAKLGWHIRFCYVVNFYTFQELFAEEKWWHFVSVPRGIFRQGLKSGKSVSVNIVWVLPVHLEVVFG